MSQNMLIFDCVMSASVSMSTHSVYCMLSCVLPVKETLVSHAWWFCVECSRLQISPVACPASCHYCLHWRLACWRRPGHQDRQVKKNDTLDLFTNLLPVVIMYMYDCRVHCFHLHQFSKVSVSHQHICWWSCFIAHTNFVGFTNSLLWAGLMFNCQILGPWQLPINIKSCSCTYSTNMLPFPNL